MKLALFDLDHTLLPIDSDQSWGEFTVRLGWHARDTFIQRNDEFYAHYQAGTLDIHEYVRFAAEAFCQRGPEVAADAHAQFMRDVVQPAIRPEALALVQKHRDALRAGGLRPVQIWVPDTRSADFAQECQRQSRMLAQDPHEAQEAAWAEAAAAQTPGWV